MDAEIALVRGLSVVPMLHDGDIDIVVEAIGGLEPATDWIRRALTAGKSVVTANKQLVSDFQKTDAGKNVTFKTSYGASGDQSRAVEFYVDYLGFVLDWEQGGHAEDLRAGRRAV